MVLFKDISYQILQLTVTLGHVNLSTLSIFKETKNYIPALGLTIHAGIIGTSHFVQIAHDSGQCLTELFACETLDKEQPEPLCFLPIADLKDKVHLNTLFYNYHFQCQRHDYDKTVTAITNWANETRTNEPFIFLEFDFNTPQQELPPSRTILAIHENSNGIAIKTVHEYQEENAIIVSESLIVI